MAAQTKMIIITSNEDIIRQFSFNKITNTHIINLDNTKQITLNENNFDNNLINLFELNSNNEQTCKRTLDSSDKNASKMRKTAKKSIDIICVICGDKSNGFHYDALTCASCKAFFRRNAFQNLELLSCLTGRGQCSVSYQTKRKCPKCRLERCFAMGMTKDLVQTSEQKEKIRKRLEENRNSTTQRLSTRQSTSNSETFLSTSDEIDRFLMDISEINDNIIESNQTEHILFGILSAEDDLTIHSLQSSFISFFQNQMGEFSKPLDLSNRASALISWSEFGNQLALRYINFFREIHEFQNLNLDDRTLLIKYNLMTVFPIYRSYNYKGKCYHHLHESTEILNRHRHFFSVCGGSYTMSDRLVNIIMSLIQITEQDPTLLSLLLIILILTPSLSMNEEQPPLKDSLAVNRLQSYYTQILWNYLVARCGQIQTCKRFTQLLTLILRMQSAAKHFQIFFRDQCRNSNTVDKLGPLMQTFMHIS